MQKFRDKEDGRELSVVIPTYNEAENIGRLIPEIERVFQSHGINGEIIVVDDGSPDGTASVVKRYLEKFDNIRVLERTEKSGLGFAYKAGFELVSGKVVMEMDADFSHSPSDIPRILREFGNGFDVVVGSRYVSGGRIIGWSAFRRIVSLVANLLVNILLRLGVRDNTSGFRAYKIEALKVLLPHVRCTGYDFQVEMIQRAKEYGLRLKEIPIVFRERVHGKSKLGRRELSLFIKLLLYGIIFKKIIR